MQIALACLSLALDTEAELLSRLHAWNGDEPARQVFENETQQSQNMLSRRLAEFDNGKPVLRTARI